MTTSCPPDDEQIDAGCSPVTAGNLADRVFRSPGPLRGAVVDFVAIGWGPLFNAADVCVVIGVVILTWRLLAEKPSPTPA